MMYLIILNNNLNKELVLVKFLLNYMKVLNNISTISRMLIQHVMKIHLWYNNIYVKIMLSKSLKILII